MGLTEIILIVVVVVLLFGAKRIPEIAKAVGRAAFEYKKAKQALENEAEELHNSVEKTSVEKPENKETQNGNK